MCGCRAHLQSVFKPRPHAVHRISVTCPCRLILKRAFMQHLNHNVRFKEFLRTSLERYLLWEISKSSKFSFSISWLNCSFLSNLLPNREILKRREVYYCMIILYSPLFVFQQAGRLTGIAVGDAKQRLPFHLHCLTSRSTRDIKVHCLYSITNPSIVVATN